MFGLLFSAGEPASLPIKIKKRVDGECHRFTEKQHIMHVHNLMGVYTVGL